MKITMKFIYIALALVAVALDTLRANAASGDLFASVDGGFVYKYPPSGVQNTFAAGLNAARGVDFDSSGNLFVVTFFCDTSCQTNIIKITPDGVQSLFATIANRVLEGLAIDGANNVFAMAFNGVVYKFTPDGVQSTFASAAGDHGYGLEFDSAGNLYTTVNFDTLEASQIWKYLPDGTPSLFATASSALYVFFDLAFDRFGNLFVSTQSGAQQPDTILKYAPDGTESTFATGLSSPAGLAFDNAGNLFVAEQFLPGTLDLPGDILKFTPAAIRSLFASGIDSRLEWLAFPRSPASPVSTTINFDAIDASANPVGGTTLANYLAQYGVTISNVTAGSEVVVDDDRRVYGGGVVFASSPHNFLSDYYLNAPNSFTLNFRRPAESVNFTRIAGGAFPTIYASWTATAFSASGAVLSSVSEFSPGVANFPAKIFTLNGPRIAKVRWDSDGFGIAAFSAVLLDDLVLNYRSPGPR